MVCYFKKFFSLFSRALIAVSVHSGHSSRFDRFLPIKGTGYHDQSVEISDEGNGPSAHPSGVPQ